MSAFMGPALAARGGEDVGGHLKAGRAALEDGLYKVAERELERCLKMAAKVDADSSLTSEAVVLLARLRLHQDRSDELLDFLKQKRRWMKKAAPGTAEFWRALAIYEIGDPSRALETLDGFDENFPESEYLPRFVRLQAWCFLKLKRTKNAVDGFARYDREFAEAEGAVENLLDWGKALIVGERLKEAALVFERVPPEAEPGLVASARIWLARIHLKAGDWEAASRQLNEISSEEHIDPDLRAEAWFLLADAHQAARATKEAAIALGKGLELVRRKDLELDGMRKLGLLKLEMGEIEDGVTLLKRFVTEAPGNPLASELQLRLSGALLEHGDADSSLSEYQYYVETFTNAIGLAEAYRGRGWALMRVERHSEASMAFEKAFDLFADDEARVECLYKTGDAHFLNGQFKQASAKYQRLVDEYPNVSIVTKASFQLAESLARAGEMESAEEVLLALAKDHPSDPLAEESLLRVGDLRSESGRFVGAAESYGLVMETYTNGAFFADAMRGRGLARYQLYRFAEAMQDFEAVAARYGDEDPKIEETRFWTAMCHYWLGNSDKSESLSKAFLVAYPDSRFAPRVFFWLGKQAYNNGDFEAAEMQFIEFYQGHAGHEDAEAALLWAGRAAASRKDYLRANEVFRQLLKDHPKSAYIPDARYEQGNALVALAKYPEAILVFQEIINKHPDYDQIADAWLRTGDSQFNLGSGDSERYEAAIQAYRAAAEHPDAGVDLKLHAEYKVGRCLQKLDRTEEAIGHYYTEVMIRFLDELERGVTHNEASRMWFGRACRNIADLLEAQGEWRKLNSVLERALNVGVPDEAGIRERIAKIRTDHWWLFY
jgi:TolA-binding protein